MLFFAIILVEGMFSHYHYHDKDIYKNFNALVKTGNDCVLTLFDKLDLLLQPDHKKNSRLEKQYLHLRISL